MDMHRLLKRQLEKSGIPSDLNSQLPDCWLDFISRVNKTYLETDQERYLNERSIEISSREMMLLNELLENAQHIAGLGYWGYAGDSELTIWSKELFVLFSLNQTENLHYSVNLLIWFMNKTATNYSNR